MALGTNCVCAGVEDQRTRFNLNQRGDSGTMQRIEHRGKPRGLADLLLPFALIEDGILLQQDGSLTAGWTYRGPDMMSAAAAEMDALSARLNSVLRLGSGWMIQCD